MNLDHWLVERTFHHSAFWDRRWLVEEKERQGLTISLCLPAYNEEKTIGKEIVIFKSELHDRYPLVDEIAVVDSGSTDRTREIAASFGAEVFRAEDYLPQYGAQAGQRRESLESPVSFTRRHHCFRRLGYLEHASSLCVWPRRTADSKPGHPVCEGVL